MNKNLSLKLFGRVAISAAVLAGLSGCASYGKWLSELSENNIVGKTESELIDSFQVGSSGHKWGRPQKITSEGSGGKAYYYKFEMDLGNGRELCGQNNNGREVTQYVCHYSIHRFEERVVFFGVNGRVSDWKQLRVWQEKYPL